MNYDNDIIDSERDCDVPRRFRRTSSCGSERTCGAEDCSSCYPAGFDSNHAKEHDEDDDKPDSGSHFADVVALLDAIKNVAHRPSEAASVLSMVAKARNAMTLALETLEEERQGEAGRRGLRARGEGVARADAQGRSRTRHAAPRSSAGRHLRRGGDAMKSHPILFSGDMVRAILDGRKTQTRRPVRADDPFGGIRYAGPCAADAEPCNPMRRCAEGTNHVHYADAFHWANLKCPYGVPGDELWVREAHASVHPCQIAEGRFSTESTAGIPGPPPVQYRTVYRADGDVPGPIYRTEAYPYRTLDPAAHITHESAIAALMRAMLRAQNGPCDPFRWTPSIHMPRWASRITLKVTDVRVQRLMDASEADIIAEGFTNSAGYQSAMMKAYGDGITYVNPWVWAITFEVRP